MSFRMLPGAMSAWQILNKAEGMQKRSSVLERLPGYKVVWATWSPPLEALGVSRLRRGEKGRGRGPFWGGEAARASFQTLCLPYPTPSSPQARPGPVDRCLGGQLGSPADQL